MTCDGCRHHLLRKHKIGTRDCEGWCIAHPRWEPKNTTTPRCGEYKLPKKTKAKAQRFVKPTILEVSEYISSRKSDVNAEDWMNHYESKGWQIGKGSMKDWKAAVRTWEKTKEPGQKDCVDCGASYGQGFKFTGLGKQKKYRCAACSKARNESTAT